MHGGEIVLCFRIAALGRPTLPVRSTFEIATDDMPLPKYLVKIEGRVDMPRFIYRL